MTDVLLPVSQDENCVHVLIVAVGQYEKQALSDLPGAAQSAQRLAKFWLTCDLAEQRKLGSLQMLVSDETSLEITAPDKSVHKIDAAMKADVSEAIKNWAERCQSKSALGVLHWIGHGEVNADHDEPNRADADILYTEDRNHTPLGETQRGLNWTTTVGLLERMVPAQLICFIDACRSHEGRMGSYTHPFGDIEIDPRKSPVLSRAAVFQLFRDEKDASPEVKTFSAQKGTKVEPDFEEGALLSEAVHLVLSRFGATREREGFAVYCHGIKDAVNHRIKRWQRAHRDLAEMSLVDGPDISPDKVISITIPQGPEGMVDFEYAPSAIHSIKGVAEADRRQIDFTVGPGPGPFWEKDLPHGHYSAEPGQRGAAAASFQVACPYRVVELS